MKKIFTYTAYTICSLPMAWAVFSLVEVMCKHWASDQCYSAWNMFELLLKLTEVL